MQFNYNINPVDISAYWRGLESAQKREANDLLLQQQKVATKQQAALQPLIQAYLGGDASALNKIAAVDSGKAGELQKLVAAQAPKQAPQLTDAELISLGGAVKRVAMADPNAAPAVIQQITQQYPQLAGFGNSLIAEFQRDPAAGIQMLDRALTPSEPKEEKVGRYQRQVMGENLAIIDSATGTIVREYPIPQTPQQKAQLAKMTADVDKAESEAQLKARLAQTEEEKKQSSIDMATEALTVIDEVLKHPNFSNAVGTFDTLTPTLRGGTQDVINMAMRLNSLLTVDNLKLMSGVLTDKDIKFLTDVASGLNITENGIKGSEKGVRKRLEEISSKIRSGLSKSQPQAPNQTQRSEQDILKQYGIE